MRVAICLFGQPRNYMRGYDSIKKFIDRQNKNIVFDIFYHCWLINTEEIPSTSYNRTEDAFYNKHDPNIIEKLNSLYKPVKFQSEASRTNFEDIVYENSQIFKNSNEHLKNNMRVVVCSQLYSRSKVRDLISEHECAYEFVIMTRFDCEKTLDIDLWTSDNTKIYASDDCPHRKTYAPDHFFVCPQDLFLKWLDIYRNLNTILYSKKVVEKFSKYGEFYHINAETLMMSWYYYNDFDLTHEILFKKYI